MERFESRVVGVPLDAMREVELARCPQCGQAGYEVTRYYRDAAGRTLAATRGCCRRCAREDARDAEGRDCAIVLVSRGAWPRLPA